MGVKSCHREGCDKTMVDRSIMGYYVCDECRDELEEYRTTWPLEMSEAGMIEKIAEFIASRKGTKRLAKVSGEDLDAMFRRLTEK